MNETPTILASSYATNCMNLQDLQMGQVAFGGQRIWNQPSSLEALLGQQEQIKTPQQMPTTAARRYVQVFIADPNDNIPLEESVLFKGEQKLTDLTDTELFFEVPIAETLKSHNEKRVKWIDKEATKRAGKDVMLDPVKIRDLKMVVVTIASF